MPPFSLAQDRSRLAATPVARTIPEGGRFAAAGSPFITAAA
jgi:hypothetical protein